MKKYNLQYLEDTLYEDLFSEFIPDGITQEEKDAFENLIIAEIESGSPLILDSIDKTKRFLLVKMEDLNSLYIMPIERVFTGDDKADLLYAVVNVDLGIKVLVGNELEFEDEDKFLSDLKIAILADFTRTNKILFEKSAQDINDGEVLFSGFYDNIKIFKINNFDFFKLKINEQFYIIPAKQLEDGKYELTYAFGNQEMVKDVHENLHQENAEYIYNQIKHTLEIVENLTQPEGNNLSIQSTTTEIEIAPETDVAIAQV